MPEGERLLLTKIKLISKSLMLTLNKKTHTADVLLEYFMLHFVFAHWAAQMPIPAKLSINFRTACAK